MEVRAFNKVGIARFRDCLAAIRFGAAEKLPDGLISDAALSSVVSPESALPVWKFSNRFEVGEAMYGLFKKQGWRRDRCIWAWLTAAYFEHLNKAPKVSEDTFWIPETDYRRYYRHRLAGPEMIYRAHREHPQDAMAVLAGVPDRFGEVAEQLSSRQETISNRTVMEVATRMYVRDGKIRPGAAAKGAGSARRLRDVLGQLELTWDLYALSPEELLALLPKEFEKFKADRDRDRGRGNAGAAGSGEMC